MMNTFLREFLKGGANIHVKSHYRVLNGKLIYVHDHDKMGNPVGTEAQFHERVQKGKSGKSLMAIDPEDRDAVLKHASALGVKTAVKYQGGKIRDHEGNVKAHGFHYVNFDSEDDAAKVHAAIQGAKGEAKEAEPNPEAPKGEVEPGKPVSFDSLQEGMALTNSEGQKLVVTKLGPNGVQLQSETGTSWPITKDKWSLYGLKAAPTKMEPKGEGSGTVDSPQESAKGKTWDSKDGKRTVVGETTVGGKKKLMIQTEGQPGNQIIDADELDKEMAFDAKNHASHQATQAKLQSEKAEADAKKADYDDTDGYAETLSPIQAGKAKKILATPIMSDGTQTTIKELVRKRIGEGWTVQKKMGELVLMDPKGDTYIPQDKIGGTGILYAKHLLAKNGEAKPEEKPQEAAQEPAGDADGGDGGTYPSEWDSDPQTYLKDVLEEAAGNFHDDPETAISQLRQGAALAGKHGITYHDEDTNKDFDAAWMKATADKMEAALPKAAPVDDEYAQAAKEAMDSSASAHKATSDLKGEYQNGDHTPDKAGETVKKHDAAIGKHVEAKNLHLAAAKKAPTPELKAHHEKMAKEHDERGMVHNEASKMHEKQHKKNQTQDTYDFHLGAAEAASMGANKAGTTHSITDSHDMAADAHEDAAKQHTGMIQHALANGDEKAAKEHASIASQHQKKAAFHKSAKAAWKATGDAEHGHISHATASALHSAAAQDAEEAGLKEAMEKHDSQSKTHMDTHKAGKTSKAADEASDEAKDWSWHPNMDEQQHAQAAKAHGKASALHSNAGNQEKAEHHAHMVDYHQKASAAATASDAAESFKGTKYSHNSKEHAQAAEAHAKAAEAHKAAMEHPGIKDSEKHQTFHSEAVVHHENMAASHKEWTEYQKKAEADDAAGDAAHSAQQEAKKKAQAPAEHPWIGQDSTKLANQGHEAVDKGDHAAAVQFYKRAALAADHAGHKEDAMKWAILAKKSMAQIKPIQKALNPKVARASVMAAARALHAERQEGRNITKAMGELGSADKLVSACSKATRAGITDIDAILAQAVGGKEKAAPYLAFLANL